MREIGLQHKDYDKARKIFENVWRDLELQYGPDVIHRFPKKITWLIGAPGSGKSVLSEYIMSAMENGVELDHQVLTVSSLLCGGQYQDIKNAAGLVDDGDVIRLLFEQLVRHQDSAPLSQHLLVDGFPRSFVQSTAILFLQERLTAHTKHSLLEKTLQLNHKSNSTEMNVVVLVVDEDKSVSRQLSRGKETHCHNELMKKLNLFDNIKEERSTDCDTELARKRYDLFRKEYNNIEHLKQHFEFTVVDTNEDINAVKDTISTTFKKHHHQMLNKSSSLYVGLGLEM